MASFNCSTHVHFKYMEVLIWGPVKIDSMFPGTTHEILVSPMASIH